MAKKILIGIVTHDKKHHAFPDLAKSIRNQTYRDFDVLFIDNSESNYEETLRKEGFKAVKDNPEGTRISRIISGRNRLREEALKGGYEYLFFLDSDVIMPEDALEKLMSHASGGKKLVSGVYLMDVKLKSGEVVAAPCLYDFHDNRHARQMMKEETEGRKLIEVYLAGLGCCLIHREILEKIVFRNIGDTDTSGEDVAFFVDCKSAGYKAYADTGIKCFHYVFPKDDERHAFYKF